MTALVCIYEHYLSVLQVSLTLACPMDLKLFPLDTQTCHLTIASYGWTANDLIYTWKVGQCADRWVQKYELLLV